MKKLMTIVIASLIAVSLGGCAKAEKGPQGDKGDPGAAGNANVKSTTASNVTWVYNAADQEFETVISYSGITQEIVNTGAVLVYLDDAGKYLQLPISHMVDPSTILFFDFEHFVGGVRINVHNSDLDNSIVPQSTTKFKIVAIAASARGQYPDLKNVEYTEVMATSAD